MSIGRHISNHNKGPNRGLSTDVVRVSSLSKTWMAECAGGAEAEPKLSRS